jgi:hypothetical protein
MFAILTVLFRNYSLCLCSVLMPYFACLYQELPELIGQESGWAAEPFCKLLRKDKCLAPTGSRTTIYACSSTPSVHHTD